MSTNSALFEVELIDLLLQKIIKKVDYDMKKVVIIVFIDFYHLNIF